METLKILVPNWRCWLNPALGGAEVFTYEVAKRWVEAGHEVTLFTSEFPNCSKEEVVDGVKVARRIGSTRFIGELKSTIGSTFRRRAT